ncbi:hypothetical protein CUAC110533_11765 [Cutibacterium acnes subsp. elongatum]
MFRDQKHHKLSTKPHAGNETSATDKQMTYEVYRRFRLGVETGQDHTMPTLTSQDWTWTRKTWRYSDGTSSKSGCTISSMDTSRKVRILALLTNLDGRYMSHTQASAIDTS